MIKLITMLKNLSLIEILFVYFGGYYNGNVYRFDYENGKVTLKLNEKINKPLFVIVSREFYDEEIKFFPIDNVKEIKKLLKLQGVRFFSLSGAHPEGYGVNIWRFETCLEGYWFKLPISYFILNSMPADRLYELDKPSLFAIKAEGKIYSTLRTTIICSAERFLASVGVSSLESKSTVIKKLSIGTQIKSLQLTSLPIFFDARILHNFKSVNVRSFLPFISLIVGYLLLVTSYIEFKHYQFDKEINTLKSQSELLFQQSDRIAFKAQELESFNQYLKGTTTASFIFDILIDVFKEAKLTRVVSKAGYLFVYGSAEKATPILSLLSANPLVTKAEFDSPIRSDRGMESFAIKITLSDAFQNETGQ